MLSGWGVAIYVKTKTEIEKERRNVCAEVSFCVCSTRGGRDSRYKYVISLGNKGRQPIYSRV